MLSADTIMKRAIVFFFAFACTWQPTIADQEAPAPPPAPAAPPPAPAVPPLATPVAFGKLIVQAGLNGAEAQEMFEVVAARAAAELAYETAEAATAAILPSPPEGVRILGVLVRQNDDAIHLIQLGYRAYNTQPLHLWLFCQAFTDAGPPVPNGDLAAIETFIADARKTRDEKIGSIEVGDLARQRIKLSYCDPVRCIDMLKTFGYKIGTVGEAIIDLKALPVVIGLPGTENHDLVGGNDPIQALKTSFPTTEADPISELLVFYHPSRPEQFSSLLDTIRTIIDVPARQIVIEAMVLEISQTGLERLGVQWDLESPSRHIDALTVGRLPSFATQANDEISTLDVRLKGVFGEFSAQIQALIREGHAEVLLRPSVGTLDNRMARINVGRTIPVVTSIANPKADLVTVNFMDKQTGITLNVRPRVNAESEQISLQVVASVRAKVPNEDVVITNSQGNEVARSPTISQREVVTYARIPNNTPFIIGGLIARDDLRDRDKVPVIGDIPLIGPLLFSTKRVNTLKREVIIVITPRLLPEHTIVGPALPEDRDAFDSFGHELFRDSYRIRAEDVFDLTFLRTNRQLSEIQRVADLIVRQNIDLETQYPFNRFSQGRFPGERILVFRQIYEVVKRRRIDERVSPEQIIFFEPNPASDAGFRASFLLPHMAKVAGVSKRVRRPDPRLIFGTIKGKAIALTYTLQSYDADAADIMQQPVPDVSLIECADGASWSRHLWDLNQPDKEGRKRHTILLRDAGDLKRVRRAIVVKLTLQLNAQHGELTLKNFSTGRQLLMPTIAEDQPYVIDEETAKYFFYTEQYYPAMRLELTRDMEAMRGVVKIPAIQKYLPEGGRAMGTLQWQP